MTLNLSLHGFDAWKSCLTPFSGICTSANLSSKKKKPRGGEYIVQQQIWFSYLMKAILLGSYKEVSSFVWSASACNTFNKHEGNLKFYLLAIPGTNSCFFLLALKQVMPPKPIRLISVSPFQLSVCNVINIISNKPTYRSNFVTFLLRTAKRSSVFVI